MVSDRTGDLKIVRAVVALVVVDVVHLFSCLQAAPKLDLCNKAVFVRISAHVGKMMTGPDAH
jgi:hypothetical protein